LFHSNKKKPITESEMGKNFVKSTSCPSPLLERGPPTVLI